ncbi:HEAT repeat domain-containing protein [Streptomyces sp. NPDC005009]
MGTRGVDRDVAAAARIARITGRMPGPGGAALVERTARLAERWYRERASWGRDRHFPEAVAVAERVAERGMGPRCVAAALLRRVREVGGVRAGELRAAGVPPRVLGLLSALGPATGESHSSHLARVALWSDAEGVLRAALEVESQDWDGTGPAVPDPFRRLVLLDVRTGRFPDGNRLVAALTGDDAGAAARAVVAAGELRAEAAVRPLLRMLCRAEPGGDWRKHEARKALERIFSGHRSTYWPQYTPVPPPPGPEQVPLLRSLTAHRSAPLRSMAVELLGRLCRPELLPVFLDALHDEDPDVREEAAVACGRTGAPLAVRPLAAMIGAGGDAWHDRGPVDGLGLLGDPRAVPALVPLLHSPVGLVRLLTVRAIRACADPDTPRRCLAALHASDRPEDDHHLFRLLGELGDPAAGPALLETLHRLTTRARWSQGAPACAAALGKLRVREAVPLLARIVADDPAHRHLGPGDGTALRREAAYALGRIGDPAAADALAEAVRDPSPDVREQAVTALTRLSGHRAAAHLAALCDGPYARRALSALAGSADPAAVPSLLRAFTTARDRRTRHLAGRALAAVGPPAAAAVAAHTAHPDPAVRRAVAWVLERQQ